MTTPTEQHQEAVKQALEKIVLTGSVREQAKRSLKLLQNNLTDLEDSDDNLRLVAALQQVMKAQGDKSRIVPKVFTEWKGKIRVSKKLLSAFGLLRRSTSPT